MWFTRDFQAYTGGHGKVWDYFTHTGAHPDWQPLIYLVDGSVDEGNPWRAAGIVPQPAFAPRAGDGVFLAGMDWLHWPDDDGQVPVINLVQGLRHADPHHPLFPFLQRPATRICVSQPVADAILATGRVNGPVHVIEAGLALPPTLSASTNERCEVVICANKDPALGLEVAACLQVHGVMAKVLTQLQPRMNYLRMVGDSAVAVTLPLAEEGFYLPGLEAMALGTAVVMPDCIGNRSYARDGVNCLMPIRQPEAIAEAAMKLLRDDPMRTRLRQAGLATAGRFDLAHERNAYHSLLDGMNATWTRAKATTSR